MWRRQSRSRSSRRAVNAARRDGGLGVPPAADGTPIVNSIGRASCSLQAAWTGPADVPASANFGWTCGGTLAGAVAAVFDSERRRWDRPAEPECADLCRAGFGNPHTFLAGLAGYALRLAAERHSVAKPIRRCTGGLWHRPVASHAAVVGDAAVALLGGISFGLYLVHLPALLTVGSWLFVTVRHSWSYGGTVTVTTAMCFPLSLLAIISHGGSTSRQFDYTAWSSSSPGTTGRRCSPGER